MSPHRFALVLTVAATFVPISVLAREDDLRNTRFGWAFVSEGSTIATSIDELSRLDESALPGDRALFARLGDHEYLIRDRATLDRVDRLVEPIRELGEKARGIVQSRSVYGTDKAGRREWKERLRPFKEKRRQLILQVSGEIETWAREAVRRGRAQRLN